MCCRLPEIHKAKERINFFSLCAELRNHIYEYALVPEEKGEGGCYDSTAICVNVVKVLERRIYVDAEEEMYHMAQKDDPEAGPFLRDWYATQWLKVSPYESKHCSAHI